jgi:hypothetical protein
VTLDRETWLAIAGANLRWLEGLGSGALEASSEEALGRFAGFFEGL